MHQICTALVCSFVEQRFEASMSRQPIVQIATHLSQIGNTYSTGPLCLPFTPLPLTTRHRSDGENWLRPTSPAWQVENRSKSVANLARIQFRSQAVPPRVTSSPMLPSVVVVVGSHVPSSTSRIQPFTPKNEKRPCPATPTIKHNQKHRSAIAEAK